MTGYGSQAFALDYIGANYTSHKIVEWAIPSIIAYADAHSNDTTDYSKDLSKDEIAEYLFKMGVSADYNKPATLEQLKRMKEDKLRLIYNSIKRTNNLVDISRVKGVDLEMNDDKYEYLLTYSFPLSLAKTFQLLAKEKAWQTNQLVVALMLLVWF